MLVKFFNKKTGFTIVNLVMAIGVLVVIAASVLVVVNPTKRIGQTKDARRLADITAIARAVEAYEIDNHQIPSDLAAATSLSVGEKFVLCGSSGSLTCDGQTYDCLVVDDSDFLGVYLPELPVDPDKSSSADSGYYVTRQADNNMVFGVCDSYDNTEITISASAALPDIIPTCGDGDQEGSEVCDDGNQFTEHCGDGAQQNSMWCNATCTAELNLNEACDDGDNYNEGCGDGEIQVAGGDYCNSTCTAVIEFAATEYCDYNSWSNDCYDTLAEEWLTSSDAGFTWCDTACSREILWCAEL